MAKFVRKRIDLSAEENSAIGCVISNQFLRDFKALIGSDLELLKSKYLRIIIQWCFTFYDIYGKAPSSTITDIFKANAESMGEDDYDLVEDALENINNKYLENKTNFDSDYIYKNVEKYIRKRSLEHKIEKIKGLLSQDKVLEAEAEYATFKRKERGEILGIDVLRDMNAVDDCFRVEKSLFKMNGALGELMGDVFKSDLIYIGGASKVSKTWTTMELALECINENLNVMWVTAEMSSEIMGKRFAQRIAGGSFKDVKEKVYVPYFDKNGNIQYEKIKVKQLTPKLVKRKYKLFQRQVGKGKLVMYDVTSTGNTVASIKNTIITAEELEGIKFDVVVVDQLNLLKSHNRGEKRHVLDSIALDLKREIAQELNTLVISPVQFNRASLKNDTNSEASIAESYSLFSHCSLLLSLAQTKEERERGVMRATASGRHGSYSGTCVMLQSLDLGKAVLESKWLKEIPNYKDVICNTTFDEEDELDLQDI